MNDPLVNIWIIAVFIATTQWENIVETVKSETTNFYTRSCSGAFSLNFIGTLFNELLNLLMQCNMSGDVLENNH